MVFKLYNNNTWKYKLIIKAKNRGNTLNESPLICINVCISYNIMFNIYNVYILKKYKYDNIACASV